MGRLSWDFQSDDGAGLIAGPQKPLRARTFSHPARPETPHSKAKRAYLVDVDAMMEIEVMESQRWGRRGRFDGQGRECLEGGFGGWQLRFLRKTTRFVLSTVGVGSDGR